MIFAVLSEAAGRGELLLVDGGLCRFRRRKKDGVVVVHEILVLPSHRGRGIGRAMIEEVRRRYPGAPIRAVCPLRYSANGFWAHLGFLAQTQGTRANQTWQLPA